MTDARWRRVEELCHQALAHPGTDQRQWLEQACAGDMKLLEEVESLLTHETTAKNFLGSGSISALLAEEPHSRPTANLTGRYLGPYHLVAVIGAGGMGHVYRARDTRLGRTVAVKVLAVASPVPHAEQRFEHEARAVGALNHPNVVSVFDVGHQDGIAFIVSELLEGESLREKLTSGPLSQRRAIDIAVQVARGLGAAHDAGLVHRDLKPENIFITHDGRAKILDFGIATRASTRDPSTSTEAALTDAGFVVGTAAYMSPEQVRAEDVDHRTDIFAFGAVLYEMLTGHRAFQAASQVEVMAAVVREDPPDITANQGHVISPSLERVTRRCLEKDRRARFQSATDLAYALDLVSGTDVRPLPPGRGGGVYAYVALTLSVLAAAVFWSTRGASPPQFFKQLTFSAGTIGEARFVPGTDSIVYTARWDRNEASLYQARADGTDVHPIVSSANWLLAVSSRGEAAVRLRGAGQLARVPLSGGAPHELMDYVNAADWSPDGADLAVAFRVSGRAKIQFPIGKTIYETGAWIRELRLSHSGNQIAFLEFPFENDDQGALVLLDLKGTRHVLTERWIGIEGLAWSKDDKEVWFTATNTTDSERAIYAVTPNGAVRLVLRVPGPLFLDDVSQDGRVLFDRMDRQWEVVARTADGNTRKLGTAQISIAKALTPRGDYAVIDDWSSREYHSYLTPTDGNLPMLLGPGAAADISPDGRWVAAILSDDHDITLLPTGVGQPRTVTNHELHHQDAQWTVDGKALIVKGYRDSESIRFWVEDVDSARTRPITPPGLDGTIARIQGHDYVVTHGTDGQGLLYPIEGQPIPAEGLAATDTVVCGSAREAALFVIPHLGGQDRSIEKVDIESGQRQPFVRLTALGDNAFIAAPRWIHISADEREIVYTQQREMNALFLATGLR